MGCAALAPHARALAPAPRCASASARACLGRRGDVFIIVRLSSYTRLLLMWLVNPKPFLLLSTPCALDRYTLYQQLLSNQTVHARLAAQAAGLQARADLPLLPVMPAYPGHALLHPPPDPASPSSIPLFLHEHTSLPAQLPSTAPRLHYRLLTLCPGAY